MCSNLYIVLNLSKYVYKEIIPILNKLCQKLEEDGVFFYLILQGQHYPETNTKQNLKKK